MKLRAFIIIALFTLASALSRGAVGYVNVPMTPGFNLVSNPLNRSDNSISNLFQNISPAIPTGLRVFVFDLSSGLFETVTFSPLSLSWVPAAGAAKEIKVGDGAFVFNPSAETVTLTLVGEVMEGNLVNPLPPGYSIKANQVPQAGAPDTFGLTGDEGDKFFKYDKATGLYVTCKFTGGKWVPALPSIAVGEAFFFFKTGDVAGAWKRTFHVISPGNALAIQRLD
jgi:hypothetical protein